MCIWLLLWVATVLGAQKNQMPPFLPTLQLNEGIWSATTRWAVNYSVQSRKLTSWLGNLSEVGKTKQLRVNATWRLESMPSEEDRTALTDASRRSLWNTKTGRQTKTVQSPTLARSHNSVVGWNRSGTLQYFKLIHLQVLIRVFAVFAAYPGIRASYFSENDRISS